MASPPRLRPGHPLAACAPDEFRRIQHAHRGRRKIVLTLLLSKLHTESGAIGARRADGGRDDRCSGEWMRKGAVNHGSIGYIVHVCSDSPAIMRRLVPE